MSALLGCLLWLASVTWAADTPFEFRDAAEAARFRELATQLRCLVCQNQTIEDSHAPLAQDLRKEVLRLMREGRTDEDIKGYLTQRYGDFVLYQPQVKPSTWLLWFGPLGILLTALLMAWRRWRLRHARAPEVLEEGVRARAMALLSSDDAAAGGPPLPAGSAAPRPSAERRPVKGARR